MLYKFIHAFTESISPASVPQSTASYATTTKPVVMIKTCYTVDWSRGAEVFIL